MEEDVTRDVMADDIDPEVVDISKITHRRICWPNPDATCLNGGCSHCNGHLFIAVQVIRNYAEQAGVLPHRASGEEDAMKAFRYGELRGWNNAETRSS